MQGQDYLNQISAENRPTKKIKSSLLGPKLLIVGLVGLIVLIVIIIIGTILSGSKGGEKNLSFALKLHFDNTEAIISEYQPNVKSSLLRSHSASLYSVLSNTNRELTDYLTEKYDYKEKSIDKKIVDEATLAKDGLEADLFEAKINGNLDRIYAHKMAYEISLFVNEELKLTNMTKNEEYREILEKSYKSLQTLYDSFNSFSETK